MGKFWKEAIGGQVQTGVYQASPRHASKQYGSFKTGRPPRLPFQFVVYFEINPLVAANNTDKYQYSSLVRAIDIPSVTFTVDKKNAYNKMRTCTYYKRFQTIHIISIRRHRESLVCSVATLLQLSFHGWSI